MSIFARATSTPSEKLCFPDRSLGHTTGGFHNNAFSGLAKFAKLNTSDQAATEYAHGAWSSHVWAMQVTNTQARVKASAPG